MIQDLSGKSEFAARTPRHENAAGKAMCGMCGYKGVGEWRCTHIHESKEFGASAVWGCPFTSGVCPGFLKKPSVVKADQPKKKSLPVPEGVKFLYVGAPRGKTRKGVPQHHGVVTVAYSIAEKCHRVEISFAFTNMGDPKKGIRPDPYSKSEGRYQAVKKLRDGGYLTVPYLYDAKRTVHEVVRAVLSHEFERLETLCGPGTKVWGRCRVPSWTKALAKRMEEREVGGRIRRLRVPPADAFAFMTPFFSTPCRGKTLAEVLGIRPKPTPQQIVARMMVDIAALGND
jgi:hypothetical protein